MAKQEMTPGEGGGANAGDESRLVKMLSLFAVVHAERGLSVLLLTLDGVLLLASYYFLKVIREPLILAAPGGAETKSYATAFLAVLLIGVFYGYRALAQRVNRLRLITYTKFFCAACLVVFCILGHMGAKIGIPFYLWVGCYSLTILAQFWAFANDIYTPEQGKRVFAVIGVGSSLGALIGSQLARLAVEAARSLQHDARPGGRAHACVSLIVRLVNARETVDAARKKEAETPPGGKGGMSMIFSHRYLLLIAAIILMVNLINTNGEYILDRTLEAVKEARDYDEKEAKIWLGEFKATYFFWANLAGVLLQLFVASRVFKYLDVRGALYIYPLLAIGELHGHDDHADPRDRARSGRSPRTASTTRSTTRPSSRSGCPLRASRSTSRSRPSTPSSCAPATSCRAAWCSLGTALALGTKVFTMLNVALGGVFLFVVILMGREHKKRAAEAMPSGRAMKAKETAQTRRQRPKPTS